MTFIRRIFLKRVYEHIEKERHAHIPTWMSYKYLKDGDFPSLNTIYGSMILFEARG